MTKTVPEILRDGADTYEMRNTIYGDTYKIHGVVAAALFPNGVKLETPEDHIRFGLFTMKIGKLTRYAQNFATGGHADSTHDDMVYTAMLAEVDADIAATAITPEPRRAESQPLVLDPAGFLGLHPSPPEVGEGGAGAYTIPGGVPQAVSPGVDYSGDTTLDEEELARILAGEEADKEPPVLIPEPPQQK
jgi:hypothetical protein